MAQQSLSSQLFMFQSRNLLWAFSAGLAGLSALSIAACVRAESPLQKAGLGLLATGLSLANVAAVRPQYHRSNQMGMHIVNAQLEGDRNWQLQAFAPPSEPKALPQADVEVIPEEEPDFFDRLPDDEIASSIMVAVLSIGGQEIDFLGKQEGLAFDRYLFSPGAGVKLKQIQEKAKDLMVNAGLENEPMISAVPGAIAIDVSRNQRVFAKYEDYIKPGEERSGFQFPVGVDQLTGELIFIDLSDPNTPHLLIAGTTGSGKSENQKVGVKYVLEHQEDGTYHIIAIDVKASTFSEFQGQKGITVIESPVVGAIAIVKAVAKMVKRREQRSGFKDVAAYNKQADRPIPRLILYVEELKDFLDGLKTVTPDELEQLSDAVSEAFESEIKVGYDKGEMKPESLVMLALGRIGQAGRSEDVNLITTTQEPDKKLLDSLIGNLPAKIALRLNSHIESNVVLPGKNSHCEQLLGKGDLFYSVPGQPLRRLQSLYLGD